MAAKRRKIVSQDLDLGHGVTTIPTDSGGIRAADKVGLHTFSDIQNVKAFGASGDGTRDDTAYIQAALDAAITTSLATGGWGLIPNGTFLISSKLTITRGGFRLLGNGCVLKAATTGMTMLQIGANATTNDDVYFAQNVCIDGLWFDGNNKAATAMRIENNYVSVYRNIYIQNCTGDGIAVHDEIYTILFDSVYVTGCGRGFHSSITGVASADKFHFVNCNFVLNTNENVLLERVTSAVFFGGSYEKGTAGIALTLTCVNVAIFGGHFETNSTADLYAYKDSVSSSAAAVSGLVVDGSWFNGTTVGPKAILLKGAQYVSINNIRSQDHTSCGIDVTNSGLSNALNQSVSITNPNGIQDSTAILNNDNVLTEFTKLARVRGTGAFAQFQLIATSTPSDWSITADGSLATGAFSLYSNTASLYRMIIDNSGHVGFGRQTVPQVSCALDLSLFTDGALMVPKMTTAQKNALTGDSGMIVYDTTLAKFQVNEAGLWVNMV